MGGSHHHHHHHHHGGGGCLEQCIAQICAAICRALCEAVCHSIFSPREENTSSQASRYQPLPTTYTSGASKGSSPSQASSYQPSASKYTPRASKDPSNGSGNREPPKPYADLPLSEQWEKLDKAFTVILTSPKALAKSMDSASTMEVKEARFWVRDAKRRCEAFLRKTEAQSRSEQQVLNDLSTRVSARLLEISQLLVELDPPEESGPKL